MCRNDVCEDAHQTSSVTTPVSLFPSLEVTVLASKTADDLALFGVYRIAAELYTEGHMAAVDREGRIVWEYATYDWGPITEVQPLPDGTIAMGQNQYLVQEGVCGSSVPLWTM